MKLLKRKGSEEKRPDKYGGYAPKDGKKPEKEEKSTVKQEAVPKPEKKKIRHPSRVHITPRSYVHWVEKQLYFSGSKRSPSKFARNAILVSLVLAAAAGYLFRSLAMYMAPAVFLIVFGILNAMLILSVDRRARFVDEILPDALQLLSANIRAGYIPSRALILSSRKEFGPLADAIKVAGKEIMSGKSLEEGLKEIPKTIKSEDLKRTIDLLIQGIRGGGQIVSLLEEIAVDIRRRQAMKKDIRANTMMYAIFIAFAGCLGAPGLYALSGYLVGTMSSLTPDVSMSSAVSSKVSFISMSGVKLSQEFLFQFSIAAILITTVFGGMLLGLIGSGREKDGLRYIPILTIIALLVFFAAGFVINTMFATILPR